MDVESFDERSGGTDEIDEAPDRPATPARYRAGGWLKNTNHSPAVVAFIRRARRALPGDPEFGDPLSAAGVGGPSAAARAADRLLERDAASREVSLAGLQVWQALTERVSGKPANREVTLVFTDLVGFLVLGAEGRRRRHAEAVCAGSPRSSNRRCWRRAATSSRGWATALMAVFADPATAVRAVRTSLDAVKAVEVDGYTPRMRAGMHTGRPQRIGSDWLGVDVNIAARVMERATRGGLIVSQATMDRHLRRGLRSAGLVRQTDTQASVFAQAGRRARRSGDVPGENSQTVARRGRGGRRRRRTHSGRRDVVRIAAAAGPDPRHRGLRGDSDRRDDRLGDASARRCRTGSSATPAPICTTSATATSAPCSSVRSSSTPGRSMCGCPGWCACWRSPN